MKPSLLTGPFSWGSKLALLLPLLLLSCSESSDAISSPDIPSDVLLAAQEGLANLKNRVPNPPDDDQKKEPS